VKNEVPGIWYMQGGQKKCVLNCSREISREENICEPGVRWKEKF
jgi:hypothetical protein